MMCPRSSTSSTNSGGEDVSLMIAPCGSGSDTVVAWAKLAAVAQHLGQAGLGLFRQRAFVDDADGIGDGILDALQLDLEVLDDRVTGAGIAVARRSPRQ